MPMRSGSQMPKHVLPGPLLVVGVGIRSRPEAFAVERPRAVHVGASEGRYDQLAGGLAEYGKGG